MSPDRWGLRPPATDDVDAVHAIFSDAATWTHLPGGRFERREQTEQMLDEARLDWRIVGLGQWVVAVDDVVVGLGGAAPRDGWWNLGFRLSPSVWGHGLATWVVDVALPAAARTRPHWPVVARSLASNPASARVSENGGLERVHTGPSPHGPELVVHADRPVDPELLAAIVALG
jgi:RimJ/RimL family protein N-acetyltransferase